MLVTAVFGAALNVAIEQWVTGDGPSDFMSLLQTLIDQIEAGMPQPAPTRRQLRSPSRRSQLGAGP
jgi:hypothetical protein